MSDNARGTAELQSTNKKQFGRKSFYPRFACAKAWATWPLEVYARAGGEIPHLRKKYFQLEEEAVAIRELGSRRKVQPQMLAQWNSVFSGCHPERGRKPESKDPEDISIALAAERHSLNDLGISVQSVKSAVGFLFCPHSRASLFLRKFVFEFAGQLVYVRGLTK